MTHAELVKRLALKADIVEKDARRVLDAALAVIAESLPENDVALRGIGTLRVVERAERQGRNMHTGETITIPARRAVKFSASKTITDALNGRACRTGGGNG